MIYLKVRIKKQFYVQYLPLKIIGLKKNSTHIDLSVLIRIPMPRVEKSGYM